MSLGSVMQLQAMNSIMKSQFDSYPADTAMVLGVAGGNGLEHVSVSKFKKVYGVDINESYLEAVSSRYGSLSGVLECLRIDLVNEADKLPHADLVIANLLIEYVGYVAFCKAVEKIAPSYVSCVIQINTGEKQWVSESPYLHAFDGLDEVHCQMEEEALGLAMSSIGFEVIAWDETPLPIAKRLMRIDYRKS